MKKLLKKAFRERGLDDSLMPKLELLDVDKTSLGGNYTSSNHTLSINPKAYRAGIFDIENIVEHETVHCQNAILRARLPQAKQEEIIKEQLLSRILKYDADSVVYSNDFLGMQTVKTPKMSEKMKKEFAEFAQNNLYDSGYGFCNQMLQIDNWCLSSNLDKTKQEFLDNIKKIIKNNPDFVAQFEDEAEAIKALSQYSASHTFRYNAVNTKSAIDVSRLPKLTQKEEQEAIESLKGFIETVEGNLRIKKNLLLTSSQDYNNYQFSFEEVQAQLNGNRKLIAELTSKIEQGKATGTLTPALEANYQEAIKKAQQTIEYKQQGYKWYQKFLESEAQPDNLALKAEVEEGLKALKELENNNDLWYNGTYLRNNPRN